MWQHLVSFFDSTFFTGLITLFVGTFAYGVYRRQKADAKQRAASVILLEIEEAEQQLTSISVDKPFLDDKDQIKLMPVASWNSYKHLFVHDFDRNETDKISDFYTRCVDYDMASAVKADVLFQRSQQELRVNMQRILADYAREYNDEIEAAKPDELEKLEQQYIERRKRFVDIYGNTSETHMYTYVPIKPFSDAKNALQGLEASLSLTSVGIKLKSISRRRNVLGRLIDKLLGRS